MSATAPSAAFWSGWLQVAPESKATLETFTVRSWQRLFCVLQSLPGTTALAGVDLCMFADEARARIKEAIHIPLHAQVMAEKDKQNRYQYAFSVCLPSGKRRFFECRTADDLANVLRAWSEALQGPAQEHQVRRA
jgi:hypothetical protein